MKLLETNILGRDRTYNQWSFSLIELLLVQSDKTFCSMIAQWALEKIRKLFAVKLNKLYIESKESLFPDLNL